MSLPESTEKPESKIIKRIRTRLLENNQNALIAIVGRTGSGKSYSAVKMAKAISPNFDLEKHLIFNPKQFLSLINSGELHKGDTIVWDEGGLFLGSRDWYKEANKSVTKVLQSFRNLNCCCIWTLPSFSFIDIAARKLFHYYFETKGIDKEKGVCILKPFELETNPLTGKLYRKYPRRKTADGRIRKMTKFRVSIMSPGDIQEYEDIKNKFTKKFNLDQQTDLTMTETKQAMLQPKDLYVIIEKIKGNIERYTTHIKGKGDFLNLPLIQADFNIGLPSAKKVKALYEQAVRERDNI